MKVLHMEIESCMSCPYMAILNNTVTTVVACKNKNIMNAEYDARSILTRPTSHVLAYIEIPKWCPRKDTELEAEKGAVEGLQLGMKRLNQYCNKLEAENEELKRSLEPVMDAASADPHEKILFGGCDITPQITDWVFEINAEYIIKHHDEGFDFKVPNIGKNLWDLVLRSPKAIDVLDTGTNGIFEIGAYKGFGRVDNIDVDAAVGGCRYTYRIVGIESLDEPKKADPVHDIASERWGLEHGPMTGDTYIVTGNAPLATIRSATDAQVELMVRAPEFADKLREIVRMSSVSTPEGEAHALPILRETLWEAYQLLEKTGIKIDCP